MQFIWGESERNYFLNESTSEEKQTALANAFVYKDWDAFEWIVSKGVKPNDVRYEMLWEAVQRQDVNAVSKLIAHGCDVHRVDDVAFRDAIRANNLEIAKMLREAGADIHAVNNEALSAAAENGHVQAVRLLCSWGVPATGFKNDPLIRAAEHGHTETAKELIRLGASVEDDAGNYLSLRAAIKQNNAEVGVLILGKLANVEEALESLGESDAYLPDDWKLRIEHWRLSASMK
jgi:Ankyrin repeats (3 copies)